MKDEQLDDLKQFIVSQISQSESRLETKLGTKIEESREEMQNGFAGVGEAIEQIHNITDNHENRLTKLEEKAV